MGTDGVSRSIDTGLADRLRQLAQRRRELHQTLRDGETGENKIKRARQLARDAAEVKDLDSAERVLGRANEMVHVHFLERGITACRSVARVSRVSRGSGRLQRLSSGFLISPRLFVTNHHVLRTAAFAADCIAEFDVEYDVMGNPRPSTASQLRPDVFFETSGDDDTGLDVSVVALSDVADKAPGQLYGYLPLLAESDPVTLGEYLNVVQHPGGEEKQVSFRENRLLERRADTLWYETDTDPGSSGSPVLNDQWTLVAVHRQSVPATNENRDPLKVDGSVYVTGDSEDDVLWIANEGVRVERVYEWLKSLNLDDERAALRDECLAG
jgi:V8-like Glu-specific endopeptidase